MQSYKSNIISGKQILIVLFVCIGISDFFLNIYLFIFFHSLEVRLNSQSRYERTPALEAHP